MGIPLKGESYGHTFEGRNPEMLHCNIIQRTATADGHNSWSTLFLGLLLSYFNIILHTTTYYNAATHRNTLQNLMAITVNGILLLDYRQDIATHRNILHHCNTPQHTAKPDGHNSWWNLVSWLSPPLLLLVPLPLHCDMTHSHVWRELFTPKSFVTWLIQPIPLLISSQCDMAHRHVGHNSCMWMICLIPVWHNSCDMTRARAS